MNNKVKVLSLKPGTKYLGLAVLENKDLIYWKNKFIKSKRTEEKKVLNRVRVILSKIIDFYHPKLIAIEKLAYPQAKESRLLNKIVKEIELMFKGKKLRVYFYSPSEVKSFICRNDKPSKMNTAKIISSCYPWLYKDYEKEKNKSWFKEKYKLRFFDAIAVGLYCLHQQRRK